MQTALRFLNRYAGLQALQDIVKKCANEHMEGIILGTLIVANLFILVYPIFKW